MSQVIVGTKVDSDLGVKLTLNSALIHTDGLGTASVYINEEEALRLVCDLIAAFHVPDSDIEVIHFPAGYSRADILRKAADRLDAGAPFDGTY